MSDDKGKTVTDATPLAGHPIQPPLVESELEGKPLKIKVQAAKSYGGCDDKETYSMRRRPRGLALIININFKGTREERKGSEVDVTNLRELFTQLHFKVKETRDDLTKDKLMEELDVFSQWKGLENSDMIIIVIMSHGSKGFVKTADGEDTDIEDILEKMNNKNCPQMMGKPKLFLFQMCRGVKSDPGHLTQTDGDSNKNVCRISSVKLIRSESRPSWEDMLVVNATILNYVAYRNHVDGSWFIQCLCRVFMEQACEKDVLKLISETNKAMAEKETDSGYRQSASYEVRGKFHPLYFNPGLPTDEEKKDEKKTRRTSKDGRMRSSKSFSCVSAAEDEAKTSKKRLSFQKTTEKDGKTKRQSKDINFESERN